MEPAAKPQALSACQKSLAEFAARRRQRSKIIFSHDMCVRENTSQAASVEFVRLWHTNYARSRLQAFCRKNPEDFSDSLREPTAKAAGSLRLPYPTGADLSISEGKWVPKKPP